MIWRKRFLFSRNADSLSWLRLALTNVQYAVSCPQKAYKSQGETLERDGARWQTQVDSFQAPLAAILSPPALGFPSSSSNNPYALYLTRLTRCSPPRPLYDCLTHSQSFFLDFCLCFFFSLRTGDSGFDTPACCEIQIHLSRERGGGGVWGENHWEERALLSQTHLLSHSSQNASPEETRCSS